MEKRKYGHSDRLGVVVLGFGVEEATVIGRSIASADNQHVIVRIIYVFRKCIIWSASLAGKNSMPAGKQFNASTVSMTVCRSTFRST